MELLRLSRQILELTPAIHAVAKQQLQIQGSDSGILASGVSSLDPKEVGVK